MCLLKYLLVQITLSTIIHQSQDKRFHVTTLDMNIQIAFHRELQLTVVTVVGVWHQDVFSVLYHSGLFMLTFGTTKCVLLFINLLCNL